MCVSSPSATPVPTDLDFNDKLTHQQVIDHDPINAHREEVIEGVIEQLKGFGYDIKNGSVLDLLDFLEGKGSSDFQKIPYFDRVYYAYISLCGTYCNYKVYDKPSSGLALEIACEKDLKDVCGQKFLPKSFAHLIRSFLMDNRHQVFSQKAQNIICEDFSKYCEQVVGRALDLEGILSVARSQICKQGKVGKGSSLPTGFFN